MHVFRHPYSDFGERLQSSAEDSVILNIVVIVAIVTIVIVIVVVFRIVVVIPSRSAPSHATCSVAGEAFGPLRIRSRARRSVPCVFGRESGVRSPLYSGAAASTSRAAAATGR